MIGKIIISDKYKMLNVIQFNNLIDDYIDHWLELQTHNNDYYQHCKQSKSLIKLLT